MALGKAIEGIASRKDGRGALGPWDQRPMDNDENSMDSGTLSQRTRQLLLLSSAS